MKQFGRYFVLQGSTPVLCRSRTVLQRVLLLFLTALILMLWLPGETRAETGEVELETERMYYRPGEEVRITLYDPDLAESAVAIKALGKVSFPIMVDLEPVSSGLFTGSFILSEPGGGSNDDLDILGVSTRTDTITIIHDRNGDDEYGDSSGEDTLVYIYSDNEKPSFYPYMTSFDSEHLLVKFTFSEQILPGDNLGEITVSPAEGGRDAGTVFCEVEARNLYVYTGHDLVAGKEYQVIIPAGALTDRAGNPFEPESEVAFSFTTREPREFHVSPAGSDLGDGTLSNPYATINRAVGEAMHGDEIVVHGGTYPESVTLDRDVTVVAIDGPDATIVSPAGESGFRVVSPAGAEGFCRIDGFTVAEAVYGIHVKGLEQGNVRVENNVITGCNVGIFIEDHPGGEVLVQKNEITGNVIAGVLVGAGSGAGDVTARWNDFYNNGCGVRNEGPGMVQAALNYWGHPVGPSHGGLELGDLVGGDVSFTPWATGPLGGAEITPELEVESPVLPEGYAGLEYRFDLPPEGNTGPCSWSVYGGSLPAGLQLVEGAYIAGVPAAQGEFTFALQATDGEQALYRDVVLRVLEEPGDPEETEEPEGPGEEEPGEDEEPAEPGAPGEPGEPEGPGESEEPGTPGEPGEPGGPGEDEEPSEDEEQPGGPVNVHEDVENERSRRDRDSDNNRAKETGAPQQGAVTPTRPTVTFWDIDRHWAREDIEYLARMGIVRGVAEGRFEPDRAITRAEFTALLIRALGIPEAGPEHMDDPDQFKDLPSGHWCRATVLAAYRSGLVGGFDDGLFRPDSPLTRQQLAVMAVRALKSAGYAETGSGGAGKRGALPGRFTDWHRVGDWALEAVETAVQAGILRGAPNGKLEPGGVATRAQAAVIIRRIMEKAALVS